MLRRTLLALAFLASLSSPAWATWALVQHPFNNACAAGTSCNVTVAATGSGHVLVMVAAFLGTNTMNSPSGTGWVHCGSQLAHDSVNNLSIDAWYNLSSTAGQTTETANFSASTTIDWVEVLEYSSTTSFSFDNCNSGTTASISTNPTVPTVTLTGSNDVLVNAIECSSTCSATATTGFTSPNDTPNNNGVSGKLNTGSGVGATYGNAAPPQTFAMTALAITEAGAGPSCPKTLLTLGVGC